MAYKKQYIIGQNEELTNVNKDFFVSLNRKQAYAIAAATLVSLQKIMLSSALSSTELVLETEDGKEADVIKSMNNSLSELNKNFPGILDNVHKSKNLKHKNIFYS